MMPPARASSSRFCEGRHRTPSGRQLQAVGGHSYVTNIDFDSLLLRCKMRHRDPRLFYLTMEVTVRRPGVKSVLELDDEARPALLQACHPKGDSR